MTREEAISFFKDMNECTYGNLEAVEMAIKALEQEPCEEVVSRDAVEDAIANELVNGESLGYSVAQDILSDLPPVTPKKKMGHWIDDNENEIDAQYGRHLYKCSECNKYADMFVCGTEDWWDIEKPNFCPYCGAKMEGNKR